MFIRFLFVEISRICKVVKNLIRQKIEVFIEDMVKRVRQSLMGNYFFFLFVYRTLLH